MILYENMFAENKIVRKRGHVDWETRREKLVDAWHSERRSSHRRTAG